MIERFEIYIVLQQINFLPLSCTVLNTAIDNVTIVFCQQQLPLVVQKLLSVYHTDVRRVRSENVSFNSFMYSLKYLCLQLEKKS